MLPGLNHNIKQHGVMYHIQTEDNGEKNPVIVTHLFVDGVILASERTSYKDQLGLPAAQLGENVARMMGKSHRMMINKLITGGYDHLAEKAAVSSREHGQDRDEGDAMASPELPQELTHEPLAANPASLPVSAPAATPAIHLVEPPAGEAAAGTPPRQNTGARKGDQPLPSPAESDIYVPGQARRQPQSELFENSASLNLYILFGHTPPTEDTSRRQPSLRQNLLALLGITPS